MVANGWRAGVLLVVLVVALLKGGDVMVEAKRKTPTGRPSLRWVAQLGHGLGHDEFDELHGDDEALYACGTSQFGVFDVLGSQQETMAAQTNVHHFLHDEEISAAEAAALDIDKGNRWDHMTVLKLDPSDGSMIWGDDFADQGHNRCRGLAHYDYHGKEHLMLAGDREDATPSRRSHVVMRSVSAEDGREDYAHQFDSEGNKASENVKAAVGVPHSDLLVVTGDTNGHFFGNRMSDNMHTKDIFVMVVHEENPDDIVWGKQIGTPEQDIATDITLAVGEDFEALAVVVGSSGGNFENPKGPRMDANFDSIAFALSLDNDGEERWRVQLRSEGMEMLMAVAGDPDGHNVYASGYSMPPMDSTEGMGATDAMLIWFNSITGEHHKAAQIGTRGNDNWRSLITGPGNMIYTCGWATDHSVAHDLRHSEEIRARAFGRHKGKDDVMVGAYRAIHPRDSPDELYELQLEWVMQVGTSASDQCLDIAMIEGNTEYVYITGKTEGDWGSKNSGKGSGKKVNDAFVAAIEVNRERSQEL